jgi:hypothetical protein
VARHPASHGGVVLMNRQVWRVVVAADVGSPHSAAHRLRDVDCRARAGEQVNHDLAGVGVEPQQVLHHLWWNGAEVGLLTTRLTVSSGELPDIEMLTGFGRLSEFRMVSFFRHPLIDRVVMYPDFLGDVPKRFSRATDPTPWLCCWRLLPCGRP